MAIGSVYLTKRGRNLLAKAVAGTNLSFTRFAIGDGYLNGAAIDDLNNVISFKETVSISKKQFNEVGKVKLSGNFTNAAVGGFYYRELGLFATDPDLGEILYAYGNADSRAEYIPVSTEEIYEKTIVLNTYISNAASVTAVIDESLVFATVEDLNMVIDTVDSHVANNNNPHVVTPAQIGAVTPSEMDAAILAEKEATWEWAKGTFSNPNLLFNTNFKKPINLAGNSSYLTTTYTINRWLSASVNGIVTVNDGYISLSSSTINGYSRLKQSLDALNFIKGKTITLSMLVKGHYAFSIFADVYLGYKTGTATDFEIVTTTISVPSNATSYFVELRGWNDIPADIKWVKLKLVRLQHLLSQSLMLKNYKIV